MKTKETIGKIVYSLFTVLAAVLLIFEIILGEPSYYNISQLIVLTLSIIYYLIAYKIPHGNLLKYLLLLFAFSQIFALNDSICLHSGEDATVVCITMILIGYFSGRLDKLKKNKYLTVFITLLFVHMLATQIVVHHVHPLLAVGNLVIWLDICASYFYCYNLHKAASAEGDRIAEILRDVNRS